MPSWPEELRSEAHALGVSPSAVATTDNDTAIDGGIDARIKDVPANSTFLFPGDNVQYKGGNFAEAGIKKELSDDSDESRRVRDAILGGASYHLALLDSSWKSGPRHWEMPSWPRSMPSGLARACACITLAPWLIGRIAIDETVCGRH